MERRSYGDDRGGAAGRNVGDDGQPLLLVKVCKRSLSPADRIRTGGADVIVAGGLEDDVDDPDGRQRRFGKSGDRRHVSDYYLNMGLTAENLARKYEITREQADEFRSPRTKSRRGHRCQQVQDEIVPLNVFVDEFDERAAYAARSFDTDEGPRFDSTIEASQAQARFHVKGTVTAGNCRRCPTVPRPRS